MPLMRKPTRRGLLAAAVGSMLIAISGVGCGSVGGGRTLARKTRLRKNEPFRATKTLQQTRRIKR
jgi:hypothetical protein